MYIFSWDVMIFLGSMGTLLSVVFLPCNFLIGQIFLCRTCFFWSLLNLNCIVAYQYWCIQIEWLDVLVGVSICAIMQFWWLRYLKSFLIGKKYFAGNSLGSGHDFLRINTQLVLLVDHCTFRTMITSAETEVKRRIVKDDSRNWVTLASWSSSQDTQSLMCL